MVLTRRVFLKGTAAGGCAVAVGGLGAGCGNDVVPAPIAKIPVGSDGRIGVLVPRYPDLHRLGGAITIDPGLASTQEVASSPRQQSAYPEAEGGILLVHRADPPDPSPYVAFQSKCPHLGCPLGYSPTDALVECPCHGSRFVAVADASKDPGQGGCAGDPVHLPARSTLMQWEVTYDPSSQTLYVNLARKLACQSGPVNFPPVVNGKITLAIAEFPALGSIGGSLVATPFGLTDRIILVRVDANTVSTTSVMCTHVGCDVAFQGGELQCPCHASRFSTSGAVLGGPANRPLKAYATSFDGTSIVIAV